MYTGEHRTRRNGSLLVLFMLILGAAGCRTVKEVPVETVEKIVVRDSIVEIHDTLTVEVPVERIVEVVPEMDTSYLKTSVAESIAYLDTYQRKLNHTLKQRGTLKAKIDTCYLTQTVDRIVEKEVPVEVEVIKHRYDALFWVSIGLNVLILGLGALRLWLRK